MKKWYQDFNDLTYIRLSDRVKLPMEVALPWIDAARAKYKVISDHYLSMLLDEAYKHWKGKYV